MTERPNLVAEAHADKAEIKLLAKTYNDKTGMTWFWSLMFGPLYFWANGFGLMGLIALMIAIPTFGIGILTFPFLASYAWNRRAEKKATNAVEASKYRR